MEKIDKLMQKAVSKKVFPGGVLLVSESNKIRFFEAYGDADIFTRQKITQETVFDLASLTKPLATALAVMKLVEEKRLDIDQTLLSLIPECATTDKTHITVGQLLYHTSGLPDYKPYYKILGKQSFLEQKELLRQLLLEEPLIKTPGKTVLYSDLGFMLLNWVVERLSGMRLDQYVAERVYQPLDLVGTGGLFFIDLINDEHLTGAFAATEYCPWRNMLISGVVHDENAYAAGGVEGHAGLFGTAKAVLRLLTALMSIYLNDDLPHLFSKKTLRLFLKRDDKWQRTLGFDTPDPVNSSAGKYFSDNSVGHLGFTGTSFWMDLTQDVIVVLLTNRIHPSRENERIREFRPIIHDAVMEEILKI